MDVPRLPFEFSAQFEPTRVLTAVREGFTNNKLRLTFSEPWDPLHSFDDIWDNFTIVSGVSGTQHPDFYTLAAPNQMLLSFPFTNNAGDPWSFTTPPVNVQWATPLLVPESGVAT